LIKHEKLEFVYLFRIEKKYMTLKDVHH